MSIEQKDNPRSVEALVGWLQGLGQRRAASAPPIGDLDERRQALKRAVNGWAGQLNGELRPPLPVTPPEEVNDAFGFVGMRIRLRKIPFIYSPNVRAFTFEVHADAMGYTVQPGISERRLPRETPLVDIEEIFAEQIREWVEASLGG